MQALGSGNEQEGMEKYIGFVIGDCHYSRSRGEPQVKRFYGV